MNNESTTPSTELVPTAGGDGIGDTDLSVIAEHLVDQARADGIALTGDGGLLPALVARVLETGLQAELTGHLRLTRSGGHGVSVVRG